MNSLHSGTAVVTGATGGLGSSYALGLAERGYDLLLVGRSATSLQTLADSIATSTGRNVRTAVFDLATEEDLSELCNLISQEADVSLLANIAGKATFSSFATISPADIDKAIAINVTALTQLSRTVARSFVEKGRGTIVNFASVLAFRPWAEFNVYNATKAFVVMLSQSLQAEFRDKGVLVQVVLPPATATPFWKEAGFSVENLPAKVVMKAEDLVSAALIGLDRREEWVLPSLSDAAVWDAFEAGRGNLVKGMMNGTLAERYTKA